MANIAVNSTYEVKYYCRLGNQLGINVRHYRVDAIAFPPVSWNQLAAGMSTRASTYYKAVLPTLARYEGVSLREIGVPTPLAPVYSTAGNTIGTVASPPLAAQVSGIITLRTIYAGRSYRGRMFIPFPTESDEVTFLDLAPVPTDDYVTRLQDLADNLVMNPVWATAGGNVTLSPVLLHQESQTTDFITSALARKAFATQRRRGDYGRPNTLPF